MNDIVKILEDISPDELAPPGMWFNGSGRLCPVAILGIRRGIDVRDYLTHNKYAGFNFFVQVANAYGVGVKTIMLIINRYDRGYEPVHIARTIAQEYGNE